MPRRMNWMRKRVMGLNVGTNEKSLFPVLNVPVQYCVYVSIVLIVLISVVMSISQYFYASELSK